MSGPSNAAINTIPLESWFWAVVFAVSGLMLTFARIGAVEAPSTDEFTEHNRDRITQFRAAPDGYRVLMLGSSQLKYATGDEWELGQRARTAQLDAAFLRITQNAAQFTDFAMLLDDILDLRPDVILIEASLIVRNRTPDLNLRRLQRFLIWNLRRKTLDHLWDPVGQDQEALQSVMKCARDFSKERLQERLRRFEARADYSTDGRSAVLARQFMSQARKLSIHVQIVDVPTTTTHRESIRSLPGAEVIRSVTKIWPENTWHFDEPMSDDYFCDFVHVDERGQATYSNWLFKQIQALQPYSA